MAQQTLRWNELIVVLRVVPGAFVEEAVPPPSNVAVGNGLLLLLSGGGGGGVGVRHTLRGMNAVGSGWQLQQTLQWNVLFLALSVPGGGGGGALGAGVCQTWQWHELNCFWC